MKFIRLSVKLQFDVFIILINVKMATIMLMNVKMPSNQLLAFNISMIKTSESLKARKVYFSAF